MFPPSRTVILTLPTLIKFNWGGWIGPTACEPTRELQREFKFPGREAVFAQLTVSCATLEFDSTLWSPKGYINKFSAFSHIFGTNNIFDAEVFLNCNSHTLTSLERFCAQQILLCGDWWLYTQSCELFNLNFYAANFVFRYRDPKLLSDRKLLEL